MQLRKRAAYLYEAMRMASETKKWIHQKPVYSMHVDNNYETPVYNCTRLKKAQG